LIFNTGHTGELLSIKAYMENTPDQSQIFIEKLTETVLANLGNEKFGVSELAKVSGISRSWLNRKILFATGKTSHRFIHEIRLNKALKILQSEDVTASEVSYRTGFSNPAYFNKCFREFFGCTPGQVKKADSRQSECNISGQDYANKERRKSPKLTLIFTFSGILILLVISFNFFYPGHLINLKRNSSNGRIIACDSSLPAKYESLFMVKGKHGRIFTVEPNGSDDTENLQEVFKLAKEAGPGSTVQLTQGTFTIGFIEVHDFNGYFHGAGKGKTTISNKTDLLCDNLWKLNLLPSLLTFIGGNVVVSDMTIKIKDGNPCALSPKADGTLYVTLTFADFSATYVPANRHIKAVVDNVDFIAGDLGYTNGFGTEGNVIMPVYCGGDFDLPNDKYHPVLSNCDFSISNCKFDLNVIGPDVNGLNENSVVTIENNEIDRSFTAIYLGALLGPEVKIKNNQFRNSTYSDIWIDNDNSVYFPDATCVKRTNYQIAGNNFQDSAGVIGLKMIDYRRTTYPNEGFPPLFEINDNTIKTQDGCVAIQGYNIVTAKIWNNKFSGTGKYGVWINGDHATRTFAESVRLNANSFSNANYTEASVYFGPYTRDCELFAANTDWVVDLGENNLIIGTTAQNIGLYSSKNPE
jgi:AraC-like DNA-binding protein